MANGVIRPSRACRRAGSLPDARVFCHTYGSRAAGGGPGAPTDTLRGGAVAAGYTPSGQPTMNLGGGQTKLRPLMPASPQAIARIRVFDRDYLCS